MKQQATRSDLNNASISSIPCRPISVKSLGLAALVMMALILPAFANNWRIESFKPLIYGKNMSDAPYGEDVTSGSSRHGITTLETSAADGKTFYIYVSPNTTGSQGIKLSQFHTWKTEISGATVPKNFKVNISPLDETDRHSVILKSGVTDTAPDRLMLLNKGQDFFELAWHAGDAYEFPNNKKKVVIGWKVTLEEIPPNSGKITSFLPYIRGRNHVVIDFGGAAMCNSRYGTTRLETIEKMPESFFIYVADNIYADAIPEIKHFDTWTIQGLGAYYPNGFTIDIIPLDKETGRASETLGELTQDAPELMLGSVEKDKSVKLSWKDESFTFTKKSVFGYKVQVTGK